EPAGLGALEAAVRHEARDELRREEPPPGEPAPDLRLRRDDRRAHDRDEEPLGPTRPARRRLRERLVPALQHAVPPDDGAAELEREEDRLELLRLQVELD